MMGILLLLLSALTPEAKELLEKGIEASHAEDYTTASRAYVEAKKLCPSDPAPYFLDGALTFIYMVDFVTDTLESRFDANLNKAEELAEVGIEANGENARDLFFIGSVRIFRAVRYGWKKQYTRALSPGMSALNYLAKAVKLDPYLYDAYLALGAYHYFWGIKGRYIPGMFSNKETANQGIREIKKVYDYGFYFTASAGQAYSWMLKKEGRAREALAVSRELVGSYPDARTFRWGLGDLYIELGMWSEARKLYEGLLADVLRDQPKCYTNHYQIKYKLAETYHGLGYDDKARSYCREVINNQHLVRRDIGDADFVKDADKLLRNLGE
ncbi:tetratricopeptide repeat protein [candidate division WOR-3 bacterium]|uniref:Tetratricopeptide repeat protein n=1 Tax=candidate division WOR-3 bacterium TaxID=2052148 RepID=A0A9D5K7T7_UNCW3|nr:tetratricopeptide repeat protein [candidate division WOR-3 bacterium]MBD3363901.1 tetratricopeptide repeat protein [candidate division WOR-3 bacterium]